MDRPATVSGHCSRTVLVNLVPLPLQILQLVAQMLIFALVYLGLRYALKMSGMTFVLDQRFKNKSQPLATVNDGGCKGWRPSVVSLCQR